MANQFKILGLRSKRSPVFASQMVATSQPLAVQAGIRTMEIGGNAADAAISVAATLTVVEPTMNGIGSDAFAIIWDGTQLHGLNASGKSPALWSPDKFSGNKDMPKFGWNSVTVPGAVSGWVEISKRFGNLPFEKTLEPAIQYARNGFHISPTVFLQWANQAPSLADQPGFSDVFMPGGKIPKIGDLFKNIDQANTLEMIGSSQGKSFYTGETAKAMVEHCQTHGGYMSLNDLENHRAEWIGTYSLMYRDYDIHEMPPNTQGISVLIALGILNNFDLKNYPENSAMSIHLQIEAIKIAFVETYKNISDLNSIIFNPKKMLDNSFLKKRSQDIDMNKSSTYHSTDFSLSDTVYLTTSDKNGMMISMIQSNYSGFGSGIVVPGTGVSMQNRGSSFSLDPNHPNRISGGKKPFHTIIPGFVMCNNKPLISFGVMGADMQPQGHVQILVKMLDYGYDVQGAADALRWKVTTSGEIDMEDGFPDKTIEELRAKGHRIRICPFGSLQFGASQIIRKIKTGYVGGSEPRRDGMAAGI